MGSVFEEASARAKSLASAVIGPTTLSDLVRALETTPRDHEAIVTALTPFCVLKPSNIEDPETIVQDGSIEILVHMLGASREASDRGAAATALASIARHAPGRDPSICARVADAGAISPLVALLKPGTDVNTLGGAARALGNLSTTASLRAPIADAGAISPLVALLTSSTDAETLGHAALALGNLASQHSKRAPIADAGAISPLVALLTSSTDEQTLDNAALALGNLSCDDLLGAPIADAGAISPLVALLTSSTDAETLGHAAVALGNLASEDSMRAPIADAGAISPLVALLASSTDEKTLDSVAFALGSLAKSGSLCAPLIKAGAIPLLASAARSPDDCTRATALQAIHVLTDSAAGRAAVASSEQAVGALLRLAHHDAGLDSGDAGIKAAEMLVADDACRKLTLLSAGAQCARLAQEVDELRASHEQLLSQSAVVSEPSATRHDVVFRCADGTQLGGSRALLVHGSSYFARQLGGGLAEGSRREVDADPDFSSAAHEALLRQLHAGGRAELPAEPSVVLELLRLACKLQPPGEGASGTERGAQSSGSDAAEAISASAGGDLVGLVVGRCEEAVLGVLDADNCLDILRHARAAGAGSRIGEAARAVVKANLDAFVSQPRWGAFVREDPLEACMLMQAVAVDLAHAQPGQRDESAAKRQRIE